MNQIMKFEDMPIEFQEINGEWVVELYSAGMAIGYIAKAKGRIYPYKERIDKAVKNAEIQPVSHGVKLFLTESQLYDLMLEVRTDKCRVFRKWLTNEVLPALNHKGTYSIPDHGKQLELTEKPYEYFDKTWCGKPVLSVKDLENLIGISRSTIYTCFKKEDFQLHEDYYRLEGTELIKFKAENPKVDKNCNHMTVITESGFVKLCTCFGVKIEKPKCFADVKKKRRTAGVLVDILEDLDIKTYDLNCLDRRGCDFVVGKNKSITGQSVIRLDDKGGKHMYIDMKSGTYEKLALAMNNIGRYLLGGFRESVDGYPIPEPDIKEEARIFATVFAALSLFADYGGFDRK